MIDIYKQNGFLGKISKKIVDMFVINLIWLILSLPIITIGSASVAVYTVLKRIDHEESHEYIKIFIKTFKESLKQSIVIEAFLIFGLILSAIWMNTNLIFLEIEINKIISLAIYLQVLWISLYIFILMTRFEMDILRYFKTAYFLSIRHFPTTILCTITFLGIIYMVVLFPPCGLFMMGIYGTVSLKLVNRILDKYV
ncbi:MAG: DUF624 domain-containing protein [Anaeromicrobium sp.]|uniref:DUF624 domain-containing protein n=1 Tax=Anaeromicrobium sp. TaxID=1929132 RepID=UPI0025DC4CF7|nr:DUF624 domain-containing protein [Anaeromicrobium sp.]MCT4593710.1 DUF624 domain-containing protein [Anaeromicrobium sp.]